MLAQPVGCLCSRRPGGGLVADDDLPWAWAAVAADLLMSPSCILGSRYIRTASEPRSEICVQSETGVVVVVVVQ